MKPPFLLSAFALCGLLVVSAANPSAAGLSDPLPFFKGVTVSCQTWGIEWQMPEMATALDELKSLGVNSIAIHPYAQIREDGHLLSNRGSPSSTTHITTPLRWARERGMSVMLVPHIAYGASPRATLALAHVAKGSAFLDGRAFVVPEDVKAVAHDVLRHRLVLSYEAAAEQIDADRVIDQVLNAVAVP